MQQHVSSRTSTQARSHAQKFFGKLEKKQLTLEEFLEILNIDQLKLDLRLNEAGDSSDYNEDQPLITIANQKNKSSVMNIALPEVLNNEEHYDEKCKSELLISDESENEIYSNNPEDINDDLNHEYLKEENKHQKRSTMQRKAKTNHAFFSK